MLLINKRVRLRQGSLIRIIGIHTDEAPGVYQYVVDMLWPNNIWHRILVSHLYNDIWSMMLAMGTYVKESKQHFKVVYLVRLNRKKYGKEKRIKSYLRR